MKINRVIATRLARAICALAVSCVCTLTLITSADAAVYKCIDAKGNVSYNQQPCAVDENAEAVLGFKSTGTADVDCRIANNFAQQIANRMRLGQSSGTVFDLYGGIDAIPGTAVGIINYVYSHKDNLTTGSARITALSAARCIAGSYGPVSCDNFPYNFIAENGGCDRATLNTMAAPSQDTPDNNATRTVQEGMTQTLGARTQGAEQPDSADCRQDMQAQLYNLVKQMRLGQSANEQGQLESREKELREKLSSC